MLPPIPHDGRGGKPDHDGKGALGKKQGSTNQHHEMNHLPGVLKTEDLENESQKLFGPWEGAESS